MGTTPAPLRPLQPIADLDPSSSPEDQCLVLERAIADLDGDVADVTFEAYDYVTELGAVEWLALGEVELPIPADVTELYAFAHGGRLTIGLKHERWSAIIHPGLGQLTLDDMAMLPPGLSLMDALYQAYGARYSDYQCDTEDLEESTRDVVFALLKSLLSGPGRTGATRTHSNPSHEADVEAVVLVSHGQQERDAAVTVSIELVADDAWSITLSANDDVSKRQILALPAAMRARTAASGREPLVDVSRALQGDASAMMRLLSGNRFVTSDYTRGILRRAATSARSQHRSR